MAFFTPMPKAAEPLVVLPKQRHEQTVILLHGRGDRADSFGAGLLSTYLPGDSTLRSVLPRAKFIFLQAPLRELAAVPGMKYHQWFDVWGLRPGCEETDLQISGLRETVELVHGTLRQEIDLVGADNVILGGLSQGCASSFISLLLWDGPPFAACIGMCGWLPFRKLLEDAADSKGPESADTPNAAKAVKALANRLGYSDGFSPPTVFQTVPVFLGYGMSDNVVVPQLGQEAAKCISDLQVKIIRREYTTLAHWYSPAMLQDIVLFLKGEAGLAVA